MSSINFTFNLGPQPGVPQSPNHRDLIRQFVMSFLGTPNVSNTAQFFNPDTIFSISTTRTSLELTSFDAYFRKMSELGISYINYINGNVVPQPLGADKAIVLTYGTCQINGVMCNFVINMILDLSTYKITNMTQVII